MTSEDAILIEMKSKLDGLYSSVMLFGFIARLLFFFTGSFFLCPDVERQRLKFLQKHVERFRRIRLEGVLPLHDRLVHTRAALHVVAFYGQKLLKRVRRAISLKGPNFHFSE